MCWVCSYLFIFVGQSQHQQIATSNVFLAICYILLFTGCLLPHALHFRKLKSPSFLISVSGLPQSGHNTNSCAYCFIFSFTLLAASFAPNKRSPDLVTSPGVASSFSTYFSMCSCWRLSTFAICTKFVMTVLLPSKCPRTFGISNLSFSNTLCGSLSLALFSNFSYSIRRENTRALYKCFCRQRYIKPGTRLCVEKDGARIINDSSAC